MKSDVQMPMIGIVDHSKSCHAITGYGIHDPHGVITRRRWYVGTAPAHGSIRLTVLVSVLHMRIGPARAWRVNWITKSKESHWHIGHSIPMAIKNCHSQGDIVGLPQCGQRIHCTIWATGGMHYPHSSELLLHPSPVLWLCSYVSNGDSGAVGATARRLRRGSRSVSRRWRLWRISGRH